MGYLINNQVNMIILLVELAILKIHWNRIVSFPGIRYVFMYIKEVYTKTFIYSYKYIFIVVHAIPKSFMNKYNLHMLLQNKWVYDLPQTGKICISILPRV